MLLVFFIPSTLFAVIDQVDCYNWSDQYIGYSKIWTDKNTAVADGKDTITIYMGLWDNNGPNEPEIGGFWYRLKASGEGNTFTPNEITSGSFPVIFTLSSTVAGEKTLQGELNGMPRGWMPLGNYGCKPGTRDTAIKVSFTNPQGQQQDATDSVSQNNSTEDADTAPTPVTKEVIPDTPVLDTVKIGSKEVTSAEVTDQKINTRKRLHFSGKTIPNATITLYFHSDPFEATTTSDAEGNWSYELEKGKLGVGEHKIQVAVTDPTTGKISEKSTAIAFTIVEAPKVETSTAAETKETVLTKAASNDYYPWMVAGAFFVVVVGGALVYVTLRFKKTEEKTSKSTKK